MPKEMLINVSEGEECRIALVEDGRLEELYMERSSSTSHVGNIYKGRITNVEASIQAAFVDFGLGRNGFLHISDLMPTYFGRKGEDIQESVGRKMARRDRPPIQRCLRRGDEIIVQIIKEGIGTKGPTLSSYLSIPGRILVMMPGMANKGVSKKIEDDEERRRLRQILDGLQPPKDVGFIIRTAGIGKTKAEIQRDFVYLTRLWQMIEKQLESGPGPMELYTEGDLVSRTVRDVYSPDIETIVVDNEDVAKRVRDVIKLSNPRAKDKVEFYNGPIPLFHKYDIEKDIEMMHSRHVPLPSGGSLVIDSTEAVVAIDINSGKFRDHSDAETTAFKTDMEAAEEIPRQLRLRDLGGVIICDFIDLRFERHRRELEETLHEKFKNDRAKTKVLRMSDFGIIEMTRQRMRPSLKRSIYSDCPHCKGAGLVKTPESMSLDVMRRLTIAAHDERVVRVEISVNPEAGLYLQNRKRYALATLEYETNKPVIVRTDQSLALDEAKLDLFDSRDGKVYLPELGMIPEQGVAPKGRPEQPGKPPAGRAGRSDTRGGDRRPQANQGRRREAAPLEEKFDLDRGEEAVDEREETREEEFTHAPLSAKPTTPHNPRLNERPESYSNFTDNDVDLGDEDEAPDAGEAQPPQQNRGPQGGNRNEPRRDQRNDQRNETRNDQRPGQRSDGRRDQRPDLRNNQRNNQQNDPRNNQATDQRNDRQNEGRQDQGGQQRPDSRRDQRPDLRPKARQDQPQRPPQNQPPRQDVNQPARQGQAQPQRPPQQQPPGAPPREGDVANPAAFQEEGADGQRRRRRRRGGRGRGRNRNRDGMDANGISDQQDDGQQAMFPPQNQEGGSEGMQVASFNESTAAFEQPSGSFTEPSRGESVEETRRPLRDEVIESRQPANAEIVTEVPVVDSEEKAKPAKGGRKKKVAAPAAVVPAKGKSRGKKAVAASTEVEATAAPAAKPSRRSSRTAKVEKVETPIPESIVRTGSTDKHHLILEESDEEPLVPSPGRRPRTYRDLDEIPDDLD